MRISAQIGEFGGIILSHNNAYIGTEENDYRDYLRVVNILPPPSDPSLMEGQITMKESNEP